MIDITTTNEAGGFRCYCCSKPTEKEVSFYRPNGKTSTSIALCEECRAELRAKLEPCQHSRVTLIGSEETGLREARCHGCGIPMTRRIDGDGYRYSPAQP